MRFAFIAKHRHIWPLAWMCTALGVSRSGFHAWLTRAPSARALADAARTAAIERSFKASDRTYGARRVWRDVLAEGLACGLPKDRAEREAVSATNVLDRDLTLRRGSRAVQRHQDQDGRDKPSPQG